MKISTLNHSVAHERNFRYDDQRFAALERAFDELAPVEAVVESMIDILRRVNPATRAVVMVGSVAVIEVNECLREVNIRGFDFFDLYTSLIAAVL